MNAGYVPPQEQFKGGIRLDTNEAPYVVDIPAIELAGINRYRDQTYDQLRQALAAHHGAHEEEIFLGNGSSQVLDTVMSAFGRGGVVVSDPTYRQYRHLAQNRGLPFVEVPSHETLMLDAEGMTDASRADGLCLVCNPNNPNGACEKEHTIDQVVRHARGMVAVDEAYIEFAHPKAKTAMHIDRQKVITIQTFSKAYGAAALRLAYAVTSPQNVRALQANAPLYPTGQLQHVAGLRLLERHAQMREKLAETVHAREQLSEALSQCRCTVYPSDASFLLFKPTSPHDAVTLHKALLNRGIVLRSMRDQARVADCLRVTVGTKEENTAFMNAMLEITSSC